MAEPPKKCKKCNLNIANPDSNKCGSCILLKEQQQLKCKVCLINLPMYGEKICRNCYNRLLQQQYLPNSIAVVTPHPYGMIQTPYGFGIMPTNPFGMLSKPFPSQMINIPSPSPYATWPTSNELPKCYRCNSYIYPNTGCYCSK